MVKPKTRAGHALKPQKPGTKTQTAAPPSADSDSSSVVSSLPSAFRLTGTACRLLWRYRVVLLGMAAVYALLQALLVTGFSVTNLGDAKQSVSEAVGTRVNEVTAGLLLYAYLLGSSSQGATPAAGAYQLILGVIMSLAIIWTLRQLYAGTAVRIRDGFYRGMYPLVPFIIVLAVLALQLLPFVLGAGVYQIIMESGLVTSLAERLVWLAVFVALTLVSLYWLSSSLFAMYIVSLPDMTPLAALRAARRLVRGRRFAVLRKVVFLPVAFLVVTTAVMLPFIMFATAVAPWVFFVWSMLTLTVVHAYYYTLYKAML